jgi:hypothetical protein
MIELSSSVPQDYPSKVPHILLSCNWRQFHRPRDAPARLAQCAVAVYPRARTITLPSTSRHIFSRGHGP